MVLQQKSSIYSLGKWYYPWVDFCLFNIFFGKQSCRKLRTWWLLCSIRGESCTTCVTGLIIYSPQSFRVFFYGPGWLISSSLFLTLAPRRGKEDLEWVLTLTCHSHFFFPLPKEGPDLMSPVVFHLHFNCHRLAWLLKGALWVDLNSLDPAPPQTTFLACGNWSVDLWYRSGLGIKDGWRPEDRSGERQDSLSKQAGHLETVRRKSSYLACISQPCLGNQGMIVLSHLPWYIAKFMMSVLKLRCSFNLSAGV